jgi:hypothetical protein
MNLAIQSLKSQGFKVFVPLLLLVTACGEGAPSASQADQQPSPEAAALKAAAQPATSFGTPKADASGLQAPSVSVDLSPSQASGGPVLPPAPVAATPVTAVAPSSATQVPEPMAIAGLAMTATGLIFIKRKRIA